MHSSAKLVGLLLDLEKKASMKCLLDLLVLEPNSRTSFVSGSASIISPKSSRGMWMTGMRQRRRGLVMAKLES